MYLSLYAHAPAVESPPSCAVPPTPGAGFPVDIVDEERMYVMARGGKEMKSAGKRRAPLRVEKARHAVESKSSGPRRQLTEFPWLIGSRSLS
jgi:hypothetical protein